jgi:hypothetical protein
MEMSEMMMREDHGQRMGYEGNEQTAQVLPGASRKYPASPQLFPQEFFTFQ